MGLSTYGHIEVLVKRLEFPSERGEGEVEAGDLHIEPVLALIGLDYPSKGGGGGWSVGGLPMGVLNPFSYKGLSILLRGVREAPSRGLDQLLHVPSANNK